MKSEMKPNHDENVESQASEEQQEKERIRLRDKRLGYFLLVVGLVWLTLMFLVGTPNNSKAEIVSDPTSYTYYAEQIEQVAQELEKLEEQYSELMKHTEKLQNITDKMQGYYDKAMATVSKIQRFVDSVSEVPNSFSELQNKWFKIKGQIETIAGGKELLDKVFGDLRSLGSDGRSIYEIINDKYHSKQAILKDVIAASNKDLAGVNSDLAEIQSIANEISQTGTLKESQDLANVILIKQLIVQRRLLAAFNRLSMAQSVISFEGVSDEVNAEFQKHLSEGKQHKIERKYLKAKFRNPELDSSTITSDDLKW